jgi:RNA recognition motif-containing protein
MNHLMTTLTDMVKDPTSVCILAATGLLGLLIGLIIAKSGCGRRSSRGESESYGDGSCVEIYVGNLSYDMTEAQMRKEFERYGAVKSSRIITNRFNSKSKGYGFIEMPNRPEAEAAIKALHDKDIFGRKLRVNEAKNKSHE